MSDQVTINEFKETMHAALDNLRHADEMVRTGQVGFVDRGFDLARLTDRSLPELRRLASAACQAGAVKSGCDDVQG